MKSVCFDVCTCSFSAALVWQMLRAYTVALLESLAGNGKTITDSDIVAWGKAFTSNPPSVHVFCQLVPMINNLSNQCLYMYNQTPTLPVCGS